MRAEFWRGKSVFLTGHTGFKGSWLSLILSELGAQVTGYALDAPTRPNLYQVARVASRITSIAGDVRDLGTLTAALKKAKPDIVIHMAAQSLVRASYVDPVTTYTTNVMGTVHLLEAIRAAGGVKATLIVTSDKCYENRETHHAFRETDPMGGHDPYSNSKGCAELVMASYGRSFFAVEHLGALGSVRAGNVIGGGDWAEDRLVPDIMRALAAGQSPVIRHPDAVRPWQHVLEPLTGYMAAIELLASGRAHTPDAWNFAPDAEEQIDVRSIAERLCAAWGKGIKPHYQVEPGAVHEAHFLTLDATKAKRELRWQPHWKLPIALEKTAAWYRAYAESADMQAFTLKQIGEYGI